MVAGVRAGRGINEAYVGQSRSKYGKEHLHSGNSRGDRIIPNWTAIASTMSVRRTAWRACYELLAARVKTSDWAFMNYGYRPGPDEESPVLDPADEPDRLCIQLYHRALVGADLRGRDVLEVGSGRGGGAAFLARNQCPATVTGLDFSPRAVALSNRHRQAPGLRFVRGDALAMPFDEASFDAVVNVESSHCYDSVPRFLAEVARVLRPGGRLYFADFRRAGALPELSYQLAASRLRVTQQTDISTGVFAALQQDNDRKSALIDQLIPAVFHRPFRRFAGIRGSSTYAAFKTGELRYLSAVLTKPPTQ